MAGRAVAACVLTSIMKKIVLLTPPAVRLMNPVTFSADLLPPKTWVPLGIASLASALRSGNFDVEFHDLHDRDWPLVEAMLSESAPGLVGISCFTFGRANAMRLAELSKRLFPEVPVVMGGPHATFFPDQVLASGNVDVVVLGEGENTIVQLARRLAQGRAPDDVRGIAFLRDGHVRLTPPRESVTDLDVFPFPAYDAFDLTQYKSPEIPPQYQELTGTHVMTSRGCPFHCEFCSVNKFFNGKWAFRSPGNVADELEKLVADRGVRHVYFSDDLFSLNHQRTIGICREILDRKLNLVWMAETRVDCVNEEMLAWMRKAGCYRVYYGVESGSPRILKSVNKGFTVEQVARAFALTHRAGIEPSCFLMVGNPGETPETIDETIALIREIRPATSPIVGITTILPGTRQYELSKRQGLISDAYWRSDAAPPLYTGEYDVDDLIQLQIRLARGVCPEVYEQMCAIGLDDDYFRLRRLLGDRHARTA
ncbi:B12-binding domain-containing radical SAM protein [Solidesulfovibrio alcoholivorans]|uniref:B12-binding domain-containing radical SAM protein n=1 Tax=Solidesulfovibrio alcoholivorans TaxID=81406 RepID=UPI000694BBE2|nr:radical SAM protein [Solidesulfovibrio alcoholivorans]